MAALKPILRGSFSFHSMSNAFINCGVSSSFVNLPTYTLFSKSLLNKHVGVLGQTLLNRNYLSSLTATTRTEEADTDVSPTPKLTKDTANSLVMKLTSDERTTLLSTLQQFESEQLKAEYKGQLAAFRWRTKLGRPSKVPGLGDVDPTGSYCPVPEDWLLKKYAETVPKPTGPQLFGVAIHNAVPFIGFGFLDNFLMIICGDYIELTLGSFMTLSTMAAAALGNTVGDVLGLGCAGYVESMATKVGVKTPRLAPIQLNMRSSRIFANIGRGIGVTIGCLLGMTPLLFMNKDGDKDKEKDKEKQPQTVPEPLIN
uniref:Transmembrane protein 65 n=1 Tax=Graphocephala atropunctata TaxID=36148 RepID=A0A1B6MER8_9HEMI